MKINRLLIGTLIVFVIALVFLYAKVTNKTTNKQVAALVNTTTTTSTPTVQLAAIGRIAPDFTLTDADGKKIALKVMAGTPVILFGMASWCGECIGEGQALTKIQQAYGNKVQIVGVAFTPGDTNATIKEFKQVGSINLPIAVDTDNVTKKYNLVNLDTTYFINKQGIIAYKSEGAMSYSDIQQQLDKLL